MIIRICENGISMRVVLLTSNSLRHKYLAFAIGSKLELALVVSESKANKIGDTSALEPEDADLISGHFKAREKSEAVFFGKYNDFPKGIPVMKTAHAGINSPEVFNRIREVGPEMLLLFGTSIIQKPLLDAFKGRVINLHLGLSPYYKGSATNLFPYFYGEPESVGATIHLATPQVDAGGILEQCRPEMEEDDDLHDIGNKVILKAGKLLPEVVQEYSVGNVVPVSQQGPGRICRNKDFTPLVLREIYHKFEKGMIGKYLREKDERDRKKPIVSGSKIK